MNSRIGILYPGGLGAALGRAIIQSGGVPLTCLSGRSESTANRAAKAGFVVRPSLREIVSDCDLVMSLVVPSAAVAVAQDFAEAIQAAKRDRFPVRSLLFVEANSVGPCTKERISAILSPTGIRLVGAAYFGPINSVGPENVLALSGSAAPEAACHLGSIVSLQIAGPQVGDASELKMSMAIITKALPALFLEMVCASAEHGHLDSSLALMRRLYPGILSFLERTLPTYPNHFDRRLQELNEVVNWLAQQKQKGGMTRCARDVFQRLSGSNLIREKDWRFDELLSEIARANLLTDGQ